MLKLYLYVTQLIFANVVVQKAHSSIRKKTYTSNVSFRSTEHILSFFGMGNGNIFK